MDNLKIKQRESDLEWVVYLCCGYEMKFIYSSKSIADCYAYIKSYKENLLIK